MSLNYHVRPWGAIYWSILVRPAAITGTASPLHSLSLMAVNGHVSGRPSGYSTYRKQFQDSRREAFRRENLSCYVRYKKRNETKKKKKTEVKKDIINHFAIKRSSKTPRAL